MDVKELIDKINDSGSRVLEPLYGPEAVEQEKQRYLSLAEGFLPNGHSGGHFAGFPAELIGGAELRVFSAPGRTELGGNHTDHNRGRVLAASIQMDAVAVAAPLKEKRVFFRSTGFPDVDVSFADEGGNLDLSPKPEEQGTTESLIRGIAAEFARREAHRGVAVGGFCANGSSTVLQGSGLSSSAAVEVLFAKIFDSLYGKGQCTAVELAQISQKAENVYFGKPCGLMDQAASASGGAVAIDFCDPSFPIVQQIQFDPTLAGYTLCIVNTRGSHAGLTPDYAAIPREMNAVARCFGKSYLRELDLSQLMSHAAEIRAAAGDRALLRAIHFFNEDRRAAAMPELLKKLAAAESGKGKRELMSQFLSLVNESGDSSRELLQNIYSPRSPEVQGLSVALAASKEFFRSRGLEAACRVHGGGFAGTIQAYVPVDALDAYRSTMDSLFGVGALALLRVRPVGAVEVLFE
jgi:galactokinase